jgi:hypothetical protein
MKGSAYMRMFGNEISYYNTKQSADNNIPNGDKPFNFLAQIHDRSLSWFGTVT